jgi:KaiC/GvpD/RAD55 family RecA-like ATPase
LIDLSQKIENDEIELPSRLDIDSLFNKVGNALATIGLGLEVVGINSILFQYKMTSAINALRKEIEQSEIEQRPISFPPQNSD